MAAGGLDDDKRAWVKAVLGVDIAAPGAAAASNGASSPVDLKDALSGWRDAIETVDEQLDELAQQLRQSKVPSLMDIAEHGMNAVTNNLKVPLMAALMDVRSGTPEALEKGGAHALLLVQDFRKHIDTDARVKACENNPRGVEVTIRATLRPALDDLASALASHLKH